jgi:type III pantothenate kinase
VLLVVDVGNTQTHFGTYRGDQLMEHWRMATVRQSTADQLGASLRSLLRLRGVELSELDGSIVSSTVPELAPEWAQVGERYLNHETVVVGPGVKTGMSIRLDNPRELGADRLVNAVAAYEKIGHACIVVDFGTAITYDVVSEEGDHLGGLIQPGVEISLEALSDRGAKLPKIDLLPPRGVIGKSTVEAIRGGVLYGYSSAVDGIVGRIKEELGADVRTIATGGLAGIVVPFCTSIDEIDADLTLRGLQLIWHRQEH